VNRRNALAPTLLAILMMALAPPAAAEMTFGIGAFGGYQWPIVQDDADPGANFGVKARLGLIPLLELEPNVTWVLNGDAETDSGGTLPAPDVVSYALNANLRVGRVFYLTGGIGWASVDVPQTVSQNEFAANFGAGIDVPMGPLWLDISPRLLVINTESGASRKHGLVMAGLDYRF
jgi:hypothetical protein